MYSISLRKIFSMFDFLFRFHSRSVRTSRLSARSTSSTIRYSRRVKTAGRSSRDLPWVRSPRSCSPNSMTSIRGLVIWRDAIQVRHRVPHAGRGASSHGLFRGHGWYAVVPSRGDPRGRPVGTSVPRARYRTDLRSGTDWRRYGVCWPVTSARRAASGD